MNAGEFFARWRVRLGYFLAILVLWLARPAPRSIVWGTLVGAIGLWIRAYAAGYLHKQELLTVSGPYSYTRNPLYLGSSVLALGAGIATNSWTSGVVLLLYFAIVYSFVMRREERELRQRHGTSFDEYARRVPLFFPRLFPAKPPSASPGAFSFSQYKKNHEYEAAIGFLFLLVVLLMIWKLRLP